MHGPTLLGTANGLHELGADGGSFWQFHRQGLHATYARAVAVAGKTILLTASDGPQPGHAGIYRASLPTVESLERCRKGLPEWFSQNIDTYCLAAAAGYAVFGTSDGQVFCSSDEGESWELAQDGLPAIQCVALGRANAP